MPKKFGGNTKALEAKERKEAVKNAEKERKERAAEEALWKDEDKHVIRKQQRKEDKEKKKQEVQEKKLALKQAYEEEMSSIKTAKPTVVPTKVTRAEIATNIQKTTSKPAKELTVDELPLEENLNRLQVDGDVARNIEDAISILSINDEKVDLHPEKRVKAAYQAFEERNLPLLKAENPNLRLSQLKQMLKKDWMKSPENPLNQRPT